MLSISNKLQITKIYDLTICVLLFVLIPVWSIPHTMAIRNIVAGILLLIVIFRNWDWIIFLKESKPLIIFGAYLIFFLVFISTDTLETLRNIKSEWLRFILYSLVGGTIGMWFVNHSKSQLFFFLGFSFSVPLLIHLILFAFKAVELQSIPWGYSGLSISHGDLGYSALQSIIFISVFLFFLCNSRVYFSCALLLITLMILSLTLAQSRGGLIFAIFSFVFVSLCFMLFNNTFRLKKKILAVVILIFTAIISIKFVSTAFPEKEWANFSHKISIALMGDPLNITCDGTDNLRKELHEKHTILSPDMEETLIDINGGTASRILIARTGLALLKENPMGSNGSRESYQIAINKICKPAIELANTHNGWIDTALAIGVMGAFIFSIFYIQNIFFASKVLISSANQDKSVATALLATSLIWILRNILDTAQRDQMLEIQGFCIALLAGLLLRKGIAK
jgi:hypothetical protein